MDLFARYCLESLYRYQHVMRLRSIDFIWYIHPTIDSPRPQSNEVLDSFPHWIKRLEIATEDLAFLLPSLFTTLDFQNSPKKGKGLHLNSSWDHFETQVKIPPCVWLRNSVLGGRGIHNIISVPFIFKMSSFEHCKVHLSFWNKRRGGRVKAKIIGFCAKRCHSPCSLEVFVKAFIVILILIASIFVDIHAKFGMYLSWVINFPLMLCLNLFCFANLRVYCRHHVYIIFYYLLPCSEMTWQHSLTRWA